MIVIPPAPGPAVPDNAKSVAYVVQALAIRRASPKKRDAIRGVVCYSPLVHVYACTVKGGEPGNKNALVRVRKGGHYTIIWTPAPVVPVIG